METAKYEAYYHAFRHGVIIYRDLGQRVHILVHIQCLVDMRLASI